MYLLISCLKYFIFN